MPTKFKTYPTVLSIAGSDSIGGAGIQADIKTCCALGTYAMTVITAVTAQNTTGVKSFGATSPKLLREQLDAVFTDVIPDAVKIGMVPDIESVKIIAEALKSLPELPKIVVDPVMVATSGDKLYTAPTAEALKEYLLPIATVVTPNVPEAEILCGHKIEPNNTAEACEEIINGTGVYSVFLKGGHFPPFQCQDGNPITIDTLIEENGMQHFFRHDYVETPNTHGTGCSLSSAIASYLALGQTVYKACESGADWLNAAIKRGAKYRIGHGHGPVKWR